MNPNHNSVHVSQPLTDLSVAYFAANAGKYAATRLFPSVGVMKQADKYYVYNRGDLLRSDAKLRGAGAEAAVGGYRISTDSYLCERYALAKDIDDPTRANADPQFDLDGEAVDYVTDQILKAQDKEFVDNFFTTAVWDGASSSTDMTGQAAPASTSSNFLQWSDVASTPIEDIHGEMDAVEAGTGYRPNVLAIGPKVKTALLNHPDIVDRIKYTQSGMVTEAILASLFGVGEVVTLSAVVNSGAENAAESNDYMAGKNALLLYRPASAGLRTPSAGYSFIWTGSGQPRDGVQVKRYRLERNESDRIEGGRWFDHKVVASDLGAFFSAAVA